jgi:hypothetical protein
MPSIKELKDKIFGEAHESAYSIHLGRNKMYHDLKATYWWYEIKRDIAEYVALCDTCQRVETKHQRHARLLQPLQVPEWKWEEIATDFAVELPRTQSGERFPLDNCGPTGQGSSLRTYQYDLYWTATSRVV